MAILCYEPDHKDVKKAKKIEFLEEGAVKVTTDDGQTITLKKFQWAENFFRAGVVLVEPERGLLIHDKPLPVPAKKDKKKEETENSD